MFRRMMRKHQQGYNRLDATSHDKISTITNTTCMKKMSFKSSVYCRLYVRYVVVLQTSVLGSDPGPTPRSAESTRSSSDPLHSCLAAATKVCQGSSYYCGVCHRWLEDVESLLEARWSPCERMELGDKVWGARVCPYWYAMLRLCPDAVVEPQSRWAVCKCFV